MRIYTSVSEIVQEIEAQLGVEVSPRVISDLLYQRKLDIRKCPVLGGRRLIPRSYLPAIVDALRTRGVISDRPGEETT